MNRSTVLTRFVQSLTVLTVVGSLLLPIAHAQTTGGLKIGFVSTEKVFKDSKPALDAQKKLDAEFSRRDKELQGMSAQLKTMADKFDKDSATMAESARSAEQRKIGDLDRELQRKQREFGEDLQRRRNEELGAVLDRANKVVREIAQKEKYDIIFQEAVYANPTLDITDKVIKALAGG